MKLTNSMIKNKKDAEQLLKKLKGDEKKLVAHLLEVAPDSFWKNLPEEDQNAS